MPSESETLGGIQHAFFAALDRHGGPTVGMVSALIVAVGIGLFARWLRRESRRDQLEAARAHARHVNVMASMPPPGDDDGCARVVAHVPLTLRHTGAQHTLVHDACETVSLSAAKVDFLSRAPTPVGARVLLSLELGEKRPLAVHGVVESVTPPAERGGAALVVTKLGPITPTERELLAHWVIRQQERQIARARAGRVCPRCGRPLADDAGAVHSTCADGARRGA